MVIVDSNVSAIDIGVNFANPSPTDKQSFCVGISRFDFCKGFAGKCYRASVLDESYACALCICIDLCDGGLIPFEIYKCSLKRWLHIQALSHWKAASVEVFQSQLLSCY